MATFLKPTEIPIDGRPHPAARILHLARHPAARSWNGSSTERWLCVGREDRIPNPGDYFTAGDREGERHRPARPRGRVPGVLQRLPPPRHPALRGAHRPLLRDDPVPLPRLDLRPRRPAHRGALHRRHRELRQGRLAAPPGGAWPPGRASSSSTWPSEPEPFDAGLGAAAGPVQPVQPAEPEGAPDHRVRRALQLEAAVPELLRVLPLRPGPPGARQAHPAHQRRERPDRGPVHRRVHGDQPRRSRA